MAGKEYLLTRDSIFSGAVLGLLGRMIHYLT